MTTKTYRATERGFYHVLGQGFALAEEGEVITTDSPQGSWMEDVDQGLAPEAVSDAPDYASLKLPELTHMAVERRIEVPKDLRGPQLKAHLIAALEAGHAS
jgi:hypothetical protein